MRIARKLQDIHQDLTRLAKQGMVAGFLANTENAEKINGLVEDIREIMMDYQVCILYRSSLPRLKFVLDLTATRYLR